VSRNVSPVVSVTRRDAVLTELRNAILAGRLKPGDRIREVQMSKELGVSRPTLREAIYQLIHEGLLVQEVYKGITVAEIDPATLSDIAVVRAVLESLAAEAIASDKDGAGREALRQAWAAYEEAAESGDPARENEAHLELHRIIWMESGNSMLRRIWPIVAASVHLALTTDMATRDDVTRHRRLHRELVEAILEGRPDRIHAAVHNHIEASARELVEMLREQEEVRPPSHS
jgi:DNA-binding GntR family transcriptional regulator